MTVPSLPQTGSLPFFSIEPISTQIFNPPDQEEDESQHGLPFGLIEFRPPQFMLDFLSRAPTHLAHKHIFRQTSESFFSRYHSKFNVLNFPVGEERDLIKQDLREYLKKGVYKENISIQDAVVIAGVLIDILEENPELSPKISKFILESLTTKPFNKIYEYLQRLELPEAGTSEDKKELRDVMWKYYVHLHKHLDKLFTKLPSQTSDAFEKKYFHTVGENETSCTINPLFFFLLLNSSQNSDYISFVAKINPEKNFPYDSPYLIIKRLLNSPGNPFIDSKTQMILSLESRIFLQECNYFIEPSNMPPVEFLELEKNIPIFKNLISYHLKHLLKSGFQLPPQHIKDYLPFFQSHASLRRLIENSIATHFKNVLLLSKSSLGYILKIKKFKEHMGVGVKDLIKVIGVRKIVMAYDGLKNLPVEHLHTLHAFVEYKGLLSLEFSKKHAKLEPNQTGHVKLFKAVSKIKWNELILTSADCLGSPVFGEFMTMIPKPVILDLKEIALNQKTLGKIAGLDKINSLILSSNHSVTSLLPLVRMPELKKVHFVWGDNSDDTAIIENYGMAYRLSCQRRLLGWDELHMECPSELLEKMLLNPTFLNDLENNCRLLASFSNIDELNSTCVKQFLGGLSKEEYELVLRHSRLGLTWFSYHFEKLKPKDLELFGLLIKSVLEELKSNPKKVFPKPSNMENLDIVFKYIKKNEDEKSLKESLPFWVRFVGEWIIPQGQHLDLAAWLVEKINGNALDQEFIINSCKETYHPSYKGEELPSDLFLINFFNFPYFDRHPKTALALMKIFSIHPAFMTFNETSLQQRIWDLLSKAAQKGLSSNLSLLIACSPYRVTSLLENPQLITAFPVIATMGLLNLLAIEYPPKDEPKRLLIALLKKFIEDTNLKECLLEHLETLKVKFHAGQFSLLLSTLGSQENVARLVEHQKLVIALLLKVPYLKGQDDELIKNWFVLFSGLIKKNLELHPLTSQFFLENPTFTEKMFPLIAKQSDLFFKYFTPFAGPVLCTLCLPQKEEKLSEMLDLFLEKGCLFEPVDPLNSHPLIWKKMRHYLREVKLENKSYLSEWVERVIAFPFITTSQINEEEQQDYCKFIDEIDKSEFVSSIIPDLPASKLQTILGYPLILMKWLRYCVTHFDSQNNLFGLPLSTSAIACFKKDSQIEPSIQNEIQKLVLAYAEMHLYSEFRREGFTFESYKCLQELAKHHSAVLDATFEKKGEKVKIHYPMVVGNLISFLMSSRLVLEAEEVQSIGNIYFYYITQLGPNFDHEIHFKNSSKREFLFILLRKVVDNRIPLSNLPIFDQEMLLETFHKEASRLSPKSFPNSYLAMGWDAWMEWFLEPFKDRFNVVCPFVIEALNNPLVKNLWTEEMASRVLSIYLKVEHTLKLEATLAFKIFKLFISQGCQELEAQKACFKLWKQSEVPELNAHPFISLLPIKSCYLNQKILKSIVAHPHKYLGLSDHLADLIFKVMLGDPLWMHQNIDFIKKIVQQFPFIFEKVFTEFSKIYKTRELEEIAERKLSDREKEWVVDSRFSVNPHYLYAAKSLVRKAEIPSFVGTIDPPKEWVFKNRSHEGNLEGIEAIQDYQNAIANHTLVIETNVSQEDVDQFYHLYNEKFKFLMDAASHLTSKYYSKLLQSLSEESAQIGARKNHLEMLDDWSKRAAVLFVVHCFDQLNFVDSSKNDYINPDFLYIEQKKVTPKTIRSHLQTLASRLLFKINIPALKKGKKECEEFYEEMNCYMFHIVNHLVKHNPYDMHGYIMQLAEIGGQCASVYQEGLPGVYYHIKEEGSRSSVLTLQDQIILLLHQSRWKWLRKAHTSLNESANSLQYLYREMEEPLGVYRVLNSKTTGNKYFVEPTTHDFVKHIQFLFQCIHTSTWIIDQLNAFIHDRPSEIGKDLVFDWFKRNPPSGTTKENVGYEIYDEEGNLKREYLRYMLVKMGILNDVHSPSLTSSSSATIFGRNSFE